MINHNQRKRKKNTTQSILIDLEHLYMEHILIDASVYVHVYVCVYMLHMPYVVVDLRRKKIEKKRKNSRYMHQNSMNKKLSERKSNKKSSE